MNKPVKYTLVGLGLVIVLVVGAALVFALTFNPNRYKDEIERLAKEQTGRTLAIKGDIKMAFWPSLGVACLLTVAAYVGLVGALRFFQVSL